MTAPVTSTRDRAVDPSPRPGRSLVTEFDLYGAPGHFLRRAYQQHNALFAEEMGQVDLTSSQFVVLAALNTFGQSDQNRLSNLVGIDRTTMSGIVERLETRDWIQRTPDPEDGRRKLVALTPLGQASFDSLIPRVDRVQERLLAPLKPADRRRLARLLRDLVEASDVAGA